VTRAVTFDCLLGLLDRSFVGLPDHRHRQNTPYALRDAAMATFSVFFMQSSSFLALCEEVEPLSRLGAVTQITQRHRTGKLHELRVYRYVNDVPVRRGPDALKVNWNC
jgi:hypothetical protein